MTPALHYLFLKMQAVLLLALGNRAGALSRFERMLQLLPADRYALASRAHVQSQLNHVEEAIASLQQLTRIAGSGPQEAAAWFNLGYVLRQAGRHDDAGPAFQRALALDPRMDRAWYGLALVLIQQRQFHEAVDALKKNTALQPLSPYGWYRLAQVRLALGQPEKALKIVEHLRQFEPKVAAQLEQETAGLAHVVTASEVRDAAH
ncbi:MAG: tetratricopeptide repeat protein [Polaromonas sp.]